MVNSSRHRHKLCIHTRSDNVSNQARRKQLQIGGAHINFFTDWGAHINFFKMTDLCNEQYSIFVQIIGGHGPPVPPPPYSYGPANEYPLQMIF